MKARNVINFPVAPGNMLDIKARATAFESIAAIKSQGPAPYIADDGKPGADHRRRRHAELLLCARNPVVYGRNFVEGDGTPPPPGPQQAPGEQPPEFTEVSSPPAMTILSHGYWERKFGGDSSNHG